MTDTHQTTTTTVTSRDGTELAYWTSGEGPPLLLVHGATADHTRWRPLLPFLESYATVYAMDRRGRGTSGDAPGYAVAREYEDVAAVVDAVAERAGRAVDVYGHSYGGVCAFGAAALTSNIRRLVLYEGWPIVEPARLALEPAVRESLDELVAAGEGEAALEIFMRDVVQVPDDERRAIRAQPTWPARVAAAHTITREMQAIAEVAFDPAQAAAIAVPVLLLTGSDSPDLAAADVEAVAAALPDARTVVLAGQQHLADVLTPEYFAAEVVQFLRGA